MLNPSGVFVSVSAYGRLSIADGAVYERWTAVCKEEEEVTVGCEGTVAAPD